MPTFFPTEQNHQRLADLASPVGSQEWLSEGWVPKSVEIGSLIGSTTNKRLHLQVCNQLVYADYCADAVCQLLILLWTLLGPNFHSLWDPTFTQTVKN